jgi:hypothetical protein
MPTKRWPQITEATVRCRARFASVVAVLDDGGQWRLRRLRGTG